MADLYASVSPLRKAEFFFLRSSANSLLNHGLLFPNDLTVFVGMHVSTQNWMYDVTVVVYSSRELHADLKLSHRVQSRQPFKVSTASGVQSRRVFVVDFTV